MRKHFETAALDSAKIMKDVFYKIESKNEKMNEKWMGIAEHFKAKLSKLSKKERSELLLNTKLELGVKDQYVEILA